MSSKKAPYKLNSGVQVFKKHLSPAEEAFKMLAAVILTIMELIPLKIVYICVCMYL